MSFPSISIEIIPGDGSELISAFSNGAQGPFLYVDDNLGVPQKILFGAYLASIPIFARLRRILRQSSDSSPDGHVSGWTDELKHVSAVVLLANPAHQTALNARRQLVKIGSIRAEHELKIAEAMLSVRECSKQAVWWRYRRWLLRRIYIAEKQEVDAIEEDSLCDLNLPPQVMRHELAVVARACEMYSRNYYAWIHRQHCLRALESLSPRAPEYVDVLRNEFRTTQTWIERHVSDYTAVQHLRQVHDVLCSLGHQPLSSDALSLITHALSLLSAFPSHESLWLYLRAAGRAIDHDDDPHQPQHQAEAISYATDRLLKRPHSANQESEGAFWNACRLLAWFVRKVRA